MFYVKIKCGNCRNLGNMNILWVGEYKIRDKPKEGIVLDEVPRLTRRIRTTMIDPTSEDDKEVEAYGAGSCPQCHHPLLVVFRTFRGYFEEIKDTADTKQQYDKAPVEVIKSYPPEPEPFVHPSFPDPIKGLFADLQDALDEGKSPAWIISGCRSVLDVAVKDICQNEGVTVVKSLYKNIEALCVHGVITNTLKDWAHEIRLEGNTAVHEIKATKEDAKEMVDFTKIFLEYVYVLPHRIDHLRTKRNP